LDPDNAKLIREALVAAAGGQEALAAEGKWDGAEVAGAMRP
jgi:hypothetical protein